MLDQSAAPDQPTPSRRSPRPGAGRYPYRPGYVLVQREPLTGEAAHIARRPIKSSADVVALVREEIGSRLDEAMVVVCLDGASRVVCLTEIARGGRHSLSAFNAEIYRVPIIVGASAIIVVHNHPSGDPTPSPEDIAFTKKATEAGRLLGISLVDHVIVTHEGRYQSMHDLEILNP